jgi:KDO2-lipid IV(A) lauroyltransferase
VSFRYYFLRILFFPIALLPLRILYLLSSFIAAINNLFFNYRKEVVIENLKNAFPNKSQQELAKLYKQFFSHFIDTLIETFKMLRKRRGFLPEHVQLTNPELLESYYRAGKSVIAVGGHYGNWEWLGTVLGDITPFKTLGVYKPLTNKAIDRIMLSIRSVNHSIMVPMKSIIRTVAKSDEPILTFLIADQAPQPDNAYWTQFLNQDTPVFLGPEKIAKASDHVVVFLAMNRKSRGYYTVTVHEISSKPKDEPPFSITEKHVRALENQIMENPAYWLWSHKRWKHTRKP